MRPNSSDRSASHSAMLPSRDRLARIRLWTQDSRLGSRRVLIGIAALGALIVVAVLTSGDSVPNDYWIRNGQRFSAEEASRIEEALSASGIEVIVNDRGQIGVPRSQRVEVLKLLKTLDIGPRPLRSIVDNPLVPNLWDSPEQREHLRWRNRERPIEAALENQEEIVWAVVKLSEEPRTYGNPGRLSASVVLKTAENRVINPSMIERIQTLMVTREPMLRLKEDITISDEKGTPYLVPGNTELGQLIQAETLAKDWEADLYRQLGHLIEGIRISVRLEWLPEPIPVVELPILPPQTVIPNGPIELTPLPGSGAELTPIASQGLNGAGTAPLGRASVLVEVPFRHYLEQFQARGEDRPPREDELRPLLEQTEQIIRATTEHVIPHLARKDLRVLPVPSKARSRPALTVSRSEAWRDQYWWALPASVGLFALLALATAGGHRLAVRRPPSRPGRVVRRDRFEEEDAGPGPADRVRELVRHDPEAAAGVLQRWVSQGGHAA